MSECADVVVIHNDDVDIVSVDDSTVSVVSTTPLINILSGRNIYGSVDNVAVDERKTIVSFAVTSTYTLSGFQAHADGDSDFYLLVGGQVQSMFSTNIINRTANITLPAPITVSAGIIITIEGVNQSLGLSLMQAIIQGEITTNG